MFGVGFWECIFILIGGIIIINPKDLPKLIRGCGKAYQYITQLYKQLLRDLNQFDQKK